MQCKCVHLMGLDICQSRVFCISSKKLDVIDSYVEQIVE